MVSNNFHKKNPEKWMEGRFQQPNLKSCFHIRRLGAAGRLVWHISLVLTAALVERCGVYGGPGQ